MRVDGRDDLYIGKLYQGTITSPDKVKELEPKQSPQLDAKEGENGTGAISDEVIKTPRKNSDIGDIKVSLGNRDSSLFGLSNLGGIQSSVMRKAVSDMQKDSVLHEYQYFVGSGAVNNTYNSGSKVVMNDEDGVVIRK